MHDINVTENFNDTATAVLRRGPDAQLRCQSAANENDTEAEANLAEVVSTRCSDGLVEKLLTTDTFKQLAHLLHEFLSHANTHHLQTSEKMLQLRNHPSVVSRAYAITGVVNKDFLSRPRTLAQGQGQ